MYCTGLKRIMCSSCNCNVKCIYYILVMLFNKIWSAFIDEILCSSQQEVSFCSTGVSSNVLFPHSNAIPQFQSHNIISRLILVNYTTVLLLYHYFKYKVKTFGNHTTIHFRTYGSLFTANILKALTQILMTF